MGASLRSMPFLTIALALLNVVHSIPVFSVTKQVNATSSTCYPPDGEAWKTKAGGPSPDEPSGATCGGRISWLNSSVGGNHTVDDSKRIVAEQFPTECGDCWVDPTRGSS